jgi:hypothetical protein
LERKLINASTCSSFLATISDFFSEDQRFRHSNFRIGFRVNNEKAYDSAESSALLAALANEDVLSSDINIFTAGRSVNC